MALVKYKINGEWVNGGVGSVNGIEPDNEGNVDISSLPDASLLNDGSIMATDNNQWVSKHLGKIYYQKDEPTEVQDNDIWIINDIPNYLCFTAVEPNSTIEMVSNIWGGDGESAPDINLEFSTDRINWNLFAVDETVIDLTNVGDKVYFRGDNERTGYFDDESDDVFANRFVMSGKVVASGSAMSLLDKEVEKVDVAPSCFTFLFAMCDSLISAPELPATTLSADCYRGMFEGCLSLVNAPELPAIELAEGCYSYMFSGCSSLTTAPELPATELAPSCYFSMFSGCSSLAAAPELPATTLADSCYGSMFSGCSSLTTAPELPATELADYCYHYMFSDCASLTTVGELPAVELTESCYSYMFYNCSYLSSLCVDFVDWHDEIFATENWLGTDYPVPAISRTFTCPNDLDTSTHDTSHVPEGWTIVKV